jgi:hypothetical protein
MGINPYRLLTAVAEGVALHAISAGLLVRITSRCSISDGRVGNFQCSCDPVLPVGSVKQLEIEGTAAGLYIASLAAVHQSRFANY